MSSLNVFKKYLKLFCLKMWNILIKDEYLDNNLILHLILEIKQFYVKESQEKVKKVPNTYWNTFIFKCIIKTMVWVFFWNLLFQKTHNAMFMQTLMQIEFV